METSSFFDLRLLAEPDFSAMPSFREMAGHIKGNMGIVLCGLRRKIAVFHPLAFAAINHGA